MNIWIMSDLVRTKILRYKIEFQFLKIIPYLLNYLNWNNEFGNNMRNMFCIIGIVGVVLFASGYYFIDNGRYVYFLGIALMIAGFVGIKKTK